MLTLIEFINTKKNKSVYSQDGKFYNRLKVYAKEYNRKGKNKAMINCMLLINYFSSSNPRACSLNAVPKQI